MFFFTKQKFQNISGTNEATWHKKLQLIYPNLRLLIQTLVLKVGADGANSLVRKKLMPSIAYHAKEYEQVSTF